jgi:MinD-like ATPase involved in chromosome partitioning or flagellar assembly
VLVACWSAKGGSGTTVVVAALGLLLGRSSQTGGLLIDLGGDLPAVLGAAPSAGPGILDWLRSDAEPDALERLAVDVGHRLRLVPRGSGGPSPDGGRLVEALGDRGPVVVDCGPPGTQPGLAVAAAARTSLLVIRPCFLAVRRAAELGIRPTGLVVVEEYARVLSHRLVADSLGVPVVARVRWDPTVARAVDAGLLASRVPRTLARGLRRLAAT